MLHEHVAGIGGNRVVPEGALGEHGTGPATETLFASALVVSRAWAARSTDCGLSAGILTAGPDQEAYSPFPAPRVI